MFDKSKSLILIFVVLTIAFASAALFYNRKPAGSAELTLKKLAAEARFKQISLDSEFAKKRLAFFNLNGVLENDVSVLLSMCENAARLQDAEGLETIALRLEALIGENAEAKTLVNNFKARASELYSSRARSKRYEIHQINSKLSDLNNEISANPNDTDKLEEKNWLEKTKAVLLEEYPKDAERAVDLNPENFRAIYDLTRFLQDRAGGYDKRVVIKNFEKVVELGNGKFEKDADYLRANLNLAVLYYQIGDYEKAKCYTAQTMEKYLARSRDDYEYLFSKMADGNWEEPDFIEAVEKVNPNREMSHPDCTKLPAKI